jgi:indoleamine 2,3-dioxygenase
MQTFLPKQDPLKKYLTKSRSLTKLEEIASELPKLLLTGKVQSLIDSLPSNALSINPLLRNKNQREINLAMVHLSFIAHAYIWGGKKPSNILPEVIAKPWVKLSEILGRPPILSYASYCLHNWYRVDRTK